MLSWSYYNDAGYLSAELVAENPRIALYGFFQVGKSTLINCLLNHYAALTGKGLATTSLTARYRYGVAAISPLQTICASTVAFTLKRANPPKS